MWIQFLTIKNLSLHPETGVKQFKKNNKRGIMLSIYHTSLMSQRHDILKINTEKKLNFDNNNGNHRREKTYHR